MAEGTLEVDLRVERGGGFQLDVRITATPGVTILFGPSGAGKSTTLAAIAGLLAPTAGRVGRIRSSGTVDAVLPEAGEPLDDAF